MEYFNRKLKISEELGDKHSISSAIGNMGVVYNKEGNYEKATECYEKQLQISLELNDKRSESMVTGNIGNIYYNQGNYEKANEYYQKQFRLAIELGDKHGAISVAVNTGNIFFSRGDYPKAAENYREGLKMAEELGDKKMILITAGNLGEVFNKLGDHRSSYESYDKAINISREYCIKPYLCNFLQAKSDLLYKLKDFIVCTTVNDEAYQIAKELNDPGQIFNSEVMNCKLTAPKDPEKAAEMLSEMLEKEADEVNRAVLCYEIWQIGRTDEQRMTALGMFRKLYEGSENFDYKAIIDELENNIPCNY